MWGFASNVIGSMGLKKSPKDPAQASSQCSDDEVSNVSRDEEGLECPICWESFNIVENVPYVLWCGHTLCQNCVFGLQSAVLRLSSQDIRIPFFVSCPWCQLLSFRIVYKGNLKFPRKNFFLLWMVESLNGDRTSHHGSLVSDNQQSVPTPRCSMSLGNQSSNNNLIARPLLRNQSTELLPHHDHSNQPSRQHFSFHKSLDFFISFTSKFPFVVIFLLIVFFAIPGSLIILALYFLLTILFALPAGLVLYFAYPILERLVNEITSS
ncbi:RING-type zinc-finger LisH dimerization motif [Arabidopsis thaliana x Arabidopsis arenosa]|uniref:RING-type zinc-finger LisH dimerization motif n=1 Tax=Arabidopsis thaliana x Arabidopsis arenosa TaxID=1240361 RepID=A0A8T2BJE6_9BRAS|nr:RING-type zinc-finger LisH dimerization motif [Arabidopsis thaliana x Arabidopsis arenosa]